MSSRPPTPDSPRSGRIRLEDGARVAVVGGGPAGSFFSILLLREARSLGRKLDVRIIERRGGLTLDDPIRPGRPATGCNFCAGGISPRMNDILASLGLSLPEIVVKNTVHTITIQSHWKNLELRVPEGREMYSVYRGARPAARSDRSANFDTFLLDAARQEGARIVTAEAEGAARQSDGRPTITTFDSVTGERSEMPADLLVFAGGVNRAPGTDPRTNPLVTDARKLMPGFVPPAVRRTMIFELEITPDAASSMDGELTFILYGSPRLKLSMGSILPKGRFATVVLIGPSIDEGEDAPSIAEVVDAFLELPQIRRILPHRPARQAPSCICRPNMVVGTARSPIGDRVVAIGDLATSRLYKDGIYSAYLTAEALVRTVLRQGVDQHSLNRGYRPVVRELRRDQRYGRLVFLLNKVLFQNPVLSRVTYQAILRERRRERRERRPLERVLWRIASGDDSYAAILGDMFNPITLLLVLIRGVFITVRNTITEWFLGLDWSGIGRHPTGVYREDLSRKVAEVAERTGVTRGTHRDFRRMYTIRLRCRPEQILAELGKLGSPDREFLRPRFVNVRRTEGGPNEVGSVVEYQVRAPFVSLSLRLVDIDPRRYIVYRVEKGFARGGVLAFDVKKGRPGICHFSILVTFNYWLDNAMARWIWRWFFPTFIHDVIWNHALCRLKDIVERPWRRGEDDPG